MSLSRTKTGIIAGSATLVLLVPLIFIAFIGGGVVIVSGMYNMLVSGCQTAATNVAPLPGSNLVGKGPLLTAFQKEFAGYPDYTDIVKEQDSIISAIVSIGKQKGISTRGQEVALATAAQETGIRNVPPGKGDLDSVGVYQQRPTLVSRNGVPYWGTPQQLSQVVYAANRFYDEMLSKVSKAGIEQLPMIEVAMMIQHPNPAAYHSRWRWDALAKEIIAQDMGNGNGAPVIVTASSQNVAQSSITCMNLPPTNVSAAVEAAKSQIGKAYIWGDGEANGFDGSGLTSWAYHKVGETVPVGASEQQRTQKAVDKSELKMGDLVYLKRSSGGNTSTEVAMWLGNDQIISAPVKAGTVAMTSIPWDRFIGATRPVTVPTPLASTISANTGAKGSAIFGDDYPLRDAAIDVRSPYNYLTRECVDFVSWRLNQQAGVTSAPFKFSGYGNALTWKTAMELQGYLADDTPAVGAVAWWGAGAGDPSILKAQDLGHVAIVSAKNIDGSITVEQYNVKGIGGGAHAYSRMDLPASYLHHLKFIHAADIAHPKLFV